MARLPSAAPRTLWILSLSYAVSEAVAAGHVQDFACFTDYDQELVCDWKVPAQHDCSRDFLLYYKSEFLSLPNRLCVPENGKGSLTCTCTIRPKYFVSGLTYILALQFNGSDVWNCSVTPALVVKPRAPKNLAIEKIENGNFNLSWEESYSPSSMLFGQPVIYEVKYWRKQHPAEVSVKAINYQAKSFEITASSLRGGYDYVASVRCNYTDYPAYWSEWSKGVEFHCDYRVTAEDVLQMAVPVSCILIMAVSVTCYFCFTKVKKEWWDQIPNPAKSHLVIKNVKFSVLCYIDEMKFPFHDLKQSHLENQISCKNCLARSLSSQNFKGKDNIRTDEKSCSCHSKFGEWFPKGGSAVLTPETVLVEESIEICECVTDAEAGGQEETSDQITEFEPCESSVGAFREHAEHNDALASMFIELLADENTPDNEDPDIITGESKTLEKHESENPSQRNPKESATRSQQPCDISHTVSLLEASQDDYNCSTASKKSQRSEESFESGYRSSSINSASLDARDLQHTVYQSLFPSSSESQHDSCILIQESPNKPSFGTKKDRITDPAYKSVDIPMSPSLGLCSSAYKSFDTLVAPSVEPRGSAYKSFDTLVAPSVAPRGSAYKSFDTLVAPSVAPRGSAYKSFDTLVAPSVAPRGSAYKSFDTLVAPSVEPRGSAYKSFDTLVAPSVAPWGSAYKSFDTLVSESVANSSLTLCFDNVCSSPPLTQFSETPELNCRDHIYRPLGNQTRYTNHTSPCTELDFPNTCSERTDFPSFFTHANDSASAFHPEEEIHKQVTYQNIQKKANTVSYPIEPQPSAHRPFDNAVRRHGTHCDDREVLSRSLQEPVIHLSYSNLRETPPSAAVCEPAQRADDHVCLIVQDFECGTIPGFASGENGTQPSEGSLWSINPGELSGDSRGGNTSRDDQLLHLLELNSQDFNSRARTIKGTKAGSCDCPGEGVQESSRNSRSTALHSRTHNRPGSLGDAGENEEEVKCAASRRRGSAASLPEPPLDSFGLHLERKTAELLVSEKLSPPLSAANPCLDSQAIHSEGSSLEQRPIELLRENNRKNETKLKLLQALAREDNCYMQVA